MTRDGSRLPPPRQQIEDECLKMNGGTTHCYLVCGKHCIYLYHLTMGFRPHVSHMPLTLSALESTAPLGPESPSKHWGNKQHNPSELLNQHFSVHVISQAVCYHVFCLFDLSVYQSTSHANKADSDTMQRRSRTTDSLGLPYKGPIYLQ